MSKEFEKITKLDGAKMNPLVFLDHRGVADFVSLALRIGYASRGIPATTIDSVVKILHDNRHDETMAFNKIYKALHSGNGRSLFQHMYEKYKRAERPVFLYSFMEAYLSGTRMVDVGCGSNYFCQYLEKIKSTVECIGTDILDNPETVVRPNVRFLLQRDPYTIPIGENDADGILLANVLHHIEEKGLGPMLTEIKRILTPEGKVFIFEDTWEEGLKPETGEELLIKSFEDLSDPDKLKAMAIIDWVGTEPAAGQIAMPRPYTFKKITTWETVFQDNGFTVEKYAYLGFPQEKLHLNPQGFFILKKTVNAFP